VWSQVLVSKLGNSFLPSFIHSVFHCCSAGHLQLASRCQYSIINPPRVSRHHHLCICRSDSSLVSCQSLGPLRCVASAWGCRLNAAHFRTSNTLSVFQSVRLSVVGEVNIRAGECSEARQKTTNKHRQRHVVNDGGTMGQTDTAWAVQWTGRVKNILH